MITLLYKMIAWTFKLSMILTLGGLYCMFHLFIALIKIPYKFILWISNLIANYILRRCDYQQETKKPYIYQITNENDNHIKKTSNKIKNNSKEKDWKEIEFDNEADLWGLSKEDRRIAKEERMTPAEFIEAEERDDDELFTDEWE